MAISIAYPTSGSTVPGGGVFAAWGTKDSDTTVIAAAFLVALGSGAAAQQLYGLRGPTPLPEWPQPPPLAREVNNDQRQARNWPPPRRTFGAVCPATGFLGAPHDSGAPLPFLPGAAAFTRRDDGEVPASRSAGRSSG